MSKANLLKEFKSNIHLKLAWTVEEFAVLTGFAAVSIKKWMDEGEVKKFQPKGYPNAKITREAAAEWFERNSFFEQNKNELYQVIPNRRNINAATQKGQASV